MRAVQRKRLVFMLYCGRWCSLASCIRQAHTGKPPKPVVPAEGPREKAQERTRQHRGTVDSMIAQIRHVQLNGHINSLSKVPLGRHSLYVLQRHHKQQFTHAERERLLTLEQATCCASASKQLRLKACCTCATDRKVSARLRKVNFAPQRSAA